MCYYLFAYTEYGCGHQLLDRRHFIDCNRVTCRRSGFHNLDEHDCANECTEEWTLPDQSLVMHICPEQCRSCLGTAGAKVNGANHDGSDDSQSDSDEEEVEEEEE
ncbi:uncharacterized protein LAESUDRAFT_809885 [Laetiporus sulphureus 93-53]|uniref:Uncharacterized protein n=1 Tax=Laetiporus sulphureus 93-53 TaxID=1314785 RepID=A0A165GZW8_9APHY|nr:uncharacterized protein LAESUDRAFT_809885 [Laetiporus sulphureus 93-53]KZT11057.1 hypothetical protein LAESUDRAFT_809885 [Laetiporus sulphureus 93-53]